MVDGLTNILSAGNGKKEWSQLIMVSGKPRQMSLGSRYSRNINDKVVLKGPVITLASGYWAKNRLIICGSSIWLSKCGWQEGQRR